jgi:hypothetical protein
MPNINAVDGWVFDGTPTTTTDPVIDLGANGNRIDLDTDNDSSIRASADDTVKVEVGGTDTVTITANGLALAQGRMSETLTVVDDDSQHMTLAAADVAAGINVHTTATGGGTVTTDTAVNYVANIPLTTNNQCVISYYINDGDQTATFAAGSGVTLADVGNTVLTNEAAVLLWRRVSATAVTLYVVSS